MKKNTTLAFTFGLVFVIAMLTLAIVFPNPTSFQYTVFRIVLALACAGIAAVIPGVLNVNIGNTVTAGGALAVFAIVYFYSPAALVSPSGPPTGSNQTVVGHLAANGSGPCPVVGFHVTADVGDRSFTGDVDQACVATFADIPASSLGATAMMTLEPPASAAAGNTSTWVIDGGNCGTPLASDMGQLPLANDATTPRTQVTMLQYSVTGNEPAATALNQFQAILQDRLANETTRLQTAASGRLGYLTRLRICRSLRGDVSSADQRQRFWTRTHSLQLWNGAIFPDGPAFQVKSEVYFDGRQIPLQMPITEDEFGNVRDDHTLLVLYSLSLDARRLRLGDDVVNALLSSARELVLDLQNRQRPIPAEILTAVQGS